MKFCELPLYKSMKDLRIYIVGVIPNLDKKVKYVIGQRLLDSCCKCICSLAAINRNKGRVKFQLECALAILTELDVIEDMIDFLTETKNLSYKQAGEIGLKLENIGNQSGGIKKALEKACQSSRG